MIRPAPAADTRPVCQGCGQVHTGPVLDGVCLDCDCQHPGGAE